MTRDQTAKPDQMLLLRTFVEQNRPDISGDDDGEGGLVIPCPFGDGTIAVRNACLLGHKPIIDGLRTTEEYVAALTKACPLTDACYLSEKEVRDTSRQLHRAHFVDRLNPEHLRTANIDILNWRSPRNFIGRFCPTSSTRTRTKPISSSIGNTNPAGWFLEPEIGWTTLPARSASASAV